MSEVDHFRRLGFPRRFAIALSDLEKAYLAQSRAVHPDYFTSGTTAELKLSLELSAAVNEAYNTLRDPFLRAEHLLALMGGPSATDHKQMPQEFLAEMLDAREEIEQARNHTEETEVIERRLHERTAKLTEEIGILFAKLEQLPLASAQRANLLGSIRGQLNAAKYLRGLIRDLNLA